VRNAVHRVCEFPDDFDEYPLDLPGLTPVPRLLQGFVSRNLFEKYLHFGEKKTVEKIILKRNENFEYYIKERKGGQIRENTRENETLKMYTTKKIGVRKFVHVCSKCDCVKVSKAAVECHFREKHMDVKPFSCGKCRYTTYNSDCFTQHTKKNGCSKNAYVCNKCNFVTSTRGNLANHKKTHYPPRYMCRNCGMKFTHSWVLKKHEKISCKKEKK
jgi:hypothetical protein